MTKTLTITVSLDASGRATVIDTQTVNAFAVGDKVVSLHPKWNKPGVAVVEKDDGSAVPYYIKYPSGTGFWLTANMLKLAPEVVYTKGDKVTRIGDTARGVGTVIDLRTQTPGTLVEWPGGRKTWNEDDEIAPYTPPVPQTLKVGDRVTHINKPRWGVGVIQAVHPHAGFSGREYTQPDHIESGVERTGETTYDVRYPDMARDTILSHWTSVAEFLRLVDSPAGDKPLTVGDRVRHLHRPAWGVGEIVSVSNDHSDLDYGPSGGAHFDGGLWYQVRFPNGDASYWWTRAQHVARA